MCSYGGLLNSFRDNLIMMREVSRHRHGSKKPHCRGLQRPHPELLACAR
jgi:hypothetical protein